MITSVGRGLIGTCTARSLVCVSVTRALAEACATPSKSLVRVSVTRWQPCHHDQDNDGELHANYEGIDCLVWDVTRNVWWQWCPI